MERPKRLSTTYVKAVKAEPVPHRYGDGRGGHGLSLLVKTTAAGGVSKSWAQRVRISGRPTSIGLGPFPVVSLEEARELAVKNVRSARAGIDPLVDRRRRAAIATFEEAAEKVIALHSESWKGGSRTAGIWRSRLARYVYPSLGNLRVDAITSADVLAVVGPLWSSKRETAQKVKTYVSAIFAWCIAEGHRADNPVDAISAALPKAGAKVSHQRALPYTQVRGALAKIWESDAAETTKGS